MKIGKGYLNIMASDKAECEVKSLLIFHFN